MLRRDGSRYLTRLAGPPIALPAAELAGYTPPQIDFAARAWAMKAEEEHRSAAVFTEIVAGLLAMGAPVDVLAAFGDVIRDEIAHATMCMDLAIALGASPQAATARVAARKDALGPRALAVLVLFEGAVGETVSTSLFHAGRSGAREPRTRAALDAILRDETRHASLCWHAAPIVLAGARLDELQRELSRSFAAYEHAVALPALRRLEAGEDIDPRLVELGVIPPAVRVETFYRAIERVSLPRLSRLGFDGQRAWDDRYRVTTEAPPA